MSKMSTLERWRKYKQEKDSKYKDIKLSNKNKRRLKEAIKDNFLLKKKGPVSINDLFTVMYGLEIEQMSLAENKLTDLIKGLKK